MRVVSVGKVLPEGSDLDESHDADSGWEAGSQFSVPGGPLLDQMRQETADAWGFVAEVGADEPMSTTSILYGTPSGQSEAATQLTLIEPGLVGFFLHGFRPGDDLIVNGENVPTPPPGPLDGRLPLYVSPTSQAWQRRDASWTCPKCGGVESMSSELRGSGGGFTAYMNWDDVSFRVISCARCGYSELYKKW